MIEYWWIGDGLVMVWQWVGGEVDWLYICWIGVLVVLN